LSFENNKDVERKRKSDPGSDTRTARPETKKKKGATAEVGTALRSIYQRTIDEDIPPDLLDLLGKLG
jgi:hypothetical protein